ncbi:MAG: hypothetical protein IK016_07045 [Lachnospiraceae bacterium]|nr:hypothetical protein [Lachnospiraceae bacterium]
MVRSLCRIVSLVLLCIFLLTSCAGQAQEAVSSPVVESSTDNTVTLESAVVRNAVRLEQIERLMGVFTRDGNYVAVGEKDAHPVLVTLTPDGEVISSENLAAVFADDGGEEQPLSLYAADAGDDGTLALLFSRETGERSAVYTLVLYDSTWQFKEQRDVGEKTGWGYGITVLPDDAVLIVWPGELSLSRKGEEIQRFGAPEDASFNSAVADVSGQCLVFQSCRGVTEVCALEPQTAALTTVLQNRSVSNTATTFCRSADGAFYLNGNERLYEYLPEEQEFRERFSWISLPFQGSMVRQMAATDRNHFACATRQSNDLYLIETMEQATVRETVVLAAMREGSWQLEQFVDLYNLQSDRYYLKVEYYDSAEQLLAKLVTSDAPDLVDVNRFQIPVNETGFCDLMPFFDADGGAIRSMLHPGMLSAIQTGGKLLEIPQGLYLNTVIGRTSDVGETAGWTLEELRQLLREKGEGYKVFSHFHSSESLAYQFCNFSMGGFIDADAHVSHFSDEAFYGMLEFCKEVQPATPDKNAPPTDENTLLAFGVFQRIEQAENVAAYTFEGEAITYIGLPTSGNSNGSWFEEAYDNLRLAVPALSNHKEAAVDVIRVMLSPEWQRKIWSLPLNVQVLEEQLSELTAKADAVLTPAQTEQMRKVIDETTVYVPTDDTIRQIIQEECAAFFAGAKSAEEVAALIDSRVTMYLNEIKPGGE